jgi:hypothetical protein
LRKKPRREFAYEIVGSDNFMNHRYFAKRDMRPLFVDDELLKPRKMTLRKTK